MSDNAIDTAATETDSTATTATTETAQTETSTTDTADEKDWKAEAEKWKAHARKHEDASKANADKAKRFDDFEASQMTEMEKLTKRTAEAEAKAAEVELRALRAEVSADKGVPGSLISGTTLEELTASADALVAFRGEKPKPDFGGGDKGGDVTSQGAQLTESDLSRMKPEEIVAAKAAGRLNTLLKIN